MTTPAQPDPIAESEPIKRARLFRLKLATAFYSPTTSDVRDEFCALLAYARQLEKERSWGENAITEDQKTELLKMKATVLDMRDAGICAEWLTTMAGAIGALERVAKARAVLQKRIDGGVEADLGFLQSGDVEVHCEDSSKLAEMQHVLIIPFEQPKKEDA